MATYLGSTNASVECQKYELISEPRIEFSFICTDIFASLLSFMEYGGTRTHSGPHHGSSTIM